MPPADSVHVHVEVARFAGRHSSHTTTRKRSRGRRGKSGGAKSIFKSAQSPVDQAHPLLLTLARRGVRLGLLMTSSTPVRCFWPNTGDAST